MKALIDADILNYEIGYSCQRQDEVRSWEWCKNLLYRKIDLICDEVEADEPPLLFMTTSPRINLHLNLKRKWEGLPPIPYRKLYREEMAKSKPYKFGRKSEKPFHYQNIVSHLLHNFDVVVAEDGLEADDWLCIYHTKAPPHTTTLCSRDKDLRQCQGLFYSWECANQRSIGPLNISELGFLDLQRSDKKGVKPKLFGGGHKWFYSQMLTGDSIDNIGGLKNYGPVFAFDHLKDCNSEYECYQVVKSVYERVYKDEWKVQFREQASLLYLIKSLDDEGNPVFWQPPVK